MTNKNKDGLSDLLPGPLKTIIIIVIMIYFGWGLESEFQQGMIAGFILMLSIWLPISMVRDK